MKIVIATSMVVFALFASVVGTYAWFLTNVSVNTDIGTFQVADTGDCGLYSINLIKFDYDKQVFGSGSTRFVSIDYLNPEKGSVNRYEYNAANGNRFGFFEDGYVQWNGTDWISSSVKPISGRFKSVVDTEDDLPVEKESGDYCLLNNPKYYIWTGSRWNIVDEEPSGEDKGDKDYLDDLLNPISPEVGDFYRVISESNKYFMWDGTTWGDGTTDIPTGGILDKGVLPDKSLLYEANWFHYVKNTTWNTVDTMNIYDPVDRIISRSSLKDLNCNAVYEVVLESSTFSSASLDASVLKMIKDDYDDSTALYLTKCADFDIFLASDLLDTNPKFIASRYYFWNGKEWEGTSEKPEGDSSSDPILVEDLPVPVAPEEGKCYKTLDTEKYYTWDDENKRWTGPFDDEPGGMETIEVESVDSLYDVGEYYEISDYGRKLYYPSYIDQEIDLSDEEEIYYRVSYLSSLKSEHVHFYDGDSTKESLASSLDVDFLADLARGDKKYLTLYVNVNYAPTQLDEAYATLVYSSNYRYVYDFIFWFSVEDRVGGE